MKRFSLTAPATLALAVIATAACAAQPAPLPPNSATTQPMPPMPPGAGGSLPGVSNSAAPMPAPPNAGAPLPPPQARDNGPLDGTPATVSGGVRRFLINPDGDVDGMLLADNTLVRFPPHVGSQVASTISPGDAVNVSGFAQQPNGTLRASLISDTKSGRSIADQPPPADAQRLPRSLAGIGLVKLSAVGRVLRVTTAPRGESDGVLLADGTVIKLAPPAALQFANLLRPGTTIAAQGYGTRNRYGEALQATAFGTPGNLTTLYGNVPQ